VGGWHAQRAAVRSQLLYVIHPLVMDMGYEGVDVQLDTQDSEWARGLHSWYSPFVVSSKQYEYSHIGRLAREPYEALLFMRIDLIAKPLMRCALASANRSQVLFTFREWKFTDAAGNVYECASFQRPRARWGVAHGPVLPPALRSQVGLPQVDRVADMMTWIPRRLFSAITVAKCMVDNHEAILCGRDRMGISPSEFGYFLPLEQHDSDPMKDWNPLYSLAARVDGPEDVNSSVALDWTGLCSSAGILDA